jgi:serine/threonine protein kinase
MTDRWQEISKLYHVALELPESERSAFLEACAPDEEVRREVESLLANEGMARDFLENPALEVVAKRIAMEYSVPFLGRELGSYRVMSLLGIGGMGEVYEARDLKLNRNVALKVLPREFALHEDRLARFLREAILLASLNHPNIASIHGLEESGETKFIILELVEGETLSERLKRGPIPVEESLKLALQIAEAIEAAHEKGIIHRDLKPANIKITPDGKAKLLDFGLAKALAADQDECRKST